MRTFFNGLFFCSLALCLSGCCTPKEVLSLANQGVSVTVQSESRLTRFINDKNEVYAKRIEAIKRISNSDLKASAEVAFEEFVAEKAGMTDEMETVKLLDAIAEKRLETEETLADQQAELEKKLQVGEPVKVPKEKYTALATAFSRLGEELSYKEWATFAVQYGKDVKSTIENLKEAAQNAKNEGASLEEKTSQH